MKAYLAAAAEAVEVEEAAEVEEEAFVIEVVVAVGIVELQIKCLVKVMVHLVFLLVLILNESIHYSCNEEDHGFFVVEKLVLLSLASFRVVAVVVKLAVEELEEAVVKLAVEVLVAVVEVLVFSLLDVVVLVVVIVVDEKQLVVD